MVSKNCSCNVQLHSKCIPKETFITIGNNEHECPKSVYRLTGISLKNPHDNPAVLCHLTCDRCTWRRSSTTDSSHLSRLQRQIQQIQKLLRTPRHHSLLQAGGPILSALYTTAVQDPCVPLSFCPVLGVNRARLTEGAALCCLVLCYTLFCGAFMY